MNRIFSKLGQMAKSIMSASSWIKGVQIFGSSSIHVDAFDSVWTIGGVQDKAGTIASLPIKFTAMDGKTELERMDSNQQQWANVILNPDPMILGRQLWEMTSMLYDIDGMAYWVLFNEFNQPISNVFEIPKRIVAFGKSSISPMYDNNDPTAVVGWTLIDGGVVKNLRNFQIVRFWKTNPKSYREGISLMDKVGDTMRLDKAAKRTNANFFVNGARPSGFLKQMERMDEALAKKWAEEFRNRYSSPDNAGKIPLIPREFDFKQDTGVRDMDFVNLHKSDRDEFFAATRAPKHHMGVNDDLNYATAEIVDRVFYQNEIQPTCEVFQDIVNNRLMLGTGMKMVFSFENIPSIQLEKYRTEGEKIKNEREKWRIASYMWRMGYPTNWINEYLVLNAPKIIAKWANEPHDPRDLQASQQPTTSGSEKELKPESEIKVDFMSALPIAEKIFCKGHGLSDPKKKSILDSVDENDIEAMDAFCRSVESDSIGDIIPQYEKAINSYFDRLEKSQITRIEAFLDGESYLSKAEGDERELTTENVDSVLFSRAKWDAILMADTEAYYIKGYKNSIAVIKSELGGFNSFAATDSDMVEAARKLQLKVVGINERIRKNIRDSLVSAIESGSDRVGMINAVKDQFKASHSRAATIARTETGIAMNSARFDALSSERPSKQWVSSNDSNVRPTHKDYSTLKSKPMDYSYAPGLKYPQDPNGDASEVINCRCVLVAGR